MALLVSKVLLVTVSASGRVVLDAAAEPTPPSRIAEGLVVGQRAIADAEGSAALEQDAAPRGRQAVGDGQPGDGHAGAAADVKDPAGVVAADGQLVRPGPLMVTLSLDRQFAARQRDGAVQPGRERDGIVAGQDARPQRWAPLSARLATVKVLSKLRSSSPSRRGRTDAARERVLIWGAATESKSPLSTVETRMQTT